MADVVSPEVRSRMMSGIRGKDTKPEMIVRRGLHAMGFRYRLHHKGMLGKPDLVFPKHRAVLFVHGCFWHKHDCRFFKWPKTRTEFWKSKILANAKRDDLTRKKLLADGWRVGVIWECALRDLHEIELPISDLSRWLRSDQKEIDISEKSNGN